MSVAEFRKEHAFDKQQMAELWALVKANDCAGVRAFMDGKPVERQAYLINAKPNGTSLMAEVPGPEMEALLTGCGGDATREDMTGSIPCSFYEWAHEEWMAPVRVGSH